MILDPSDEIMTEMRSRFTSAIDGEGKPVRVVSYGGKDYPIYTVVPQDTPFDYVLMSPLEMIDDSTKDSFIYECTQLWDIVTFGGKRGSWKAANSISSQLMNTIQGVKITTEHFKSTVEPYIDSTNTFPEEIEGGLIMRKLIRFRYNLQQT